MDRGIIVCGLALLAFALFVRFGIFRILRSWQSPTPDDKAEPRDSRRRDAAHESGHGYFCWRSRHVHTVGAVSIARTGGGGIDFLFVRHDRHDPYMLWDDALISLAGIAAEAAVFGSFFAKEATGDLQKAKEAAQDLARNEDIDGIRYAPPWSEDEEEHSLTDVQDFLTGPLPSRVRDIMNRAYRHASYVLSHDRARLDALREELHQRKRLHAEHLERLLGPRPAAVPQSLPPGLPPSHP